MALELMSHLKARLQQVHSEQLKLCKAEEQKTLKKTLKANAGLRKTKSEAADLVASATHKLLT